MRKEDVHLELHDDYLVLSGERHQEQEQNEQGWYRSERSYGREQQQPKGRRIEIQ